MFKYTSNKYYFKNHILVKFKALLDLDSVGVWYLTIILIKKLNLKKFHLRD